MLVRLLVCAFSLGLASCRSSGPPMAESAGLRFRRCAAIRPVSGTEKLRLGTLRARRTGVSLRIADRGDGALRLGAIAGIQEAAEDNRRNLRGAMEFFRERRVEAVLVAGGIGRNETAIATLLRDLGSLHVPVLTVVGSEEPLDDYLDGIDLARGDGSALVDLTSVREVTFGDGRVVSLPGAANPFYLEAKDRGCAFLRADVRALGRILDGGPRPTILLAAAAPRGRGPGSIDFARGGVNAGDHGLATLLDQQGVRFGVFGHIYEAGPAATRRDGTRVAEGEWSSELLVNPGAIEAVPYLHPDGSATIGTAVALEVEPERARFLVWRAGGLPSTAR